MEDLCLTEDSDGDSDGDADDADDAAVASSSDYFVFPDLLPLAAVAKRFKATCGKLSCRAPAKLLTTPQPPLRKATHPAAPNPRKATLHPAAKKPVTTMQVSDDHHTSRILVVAIPHSLLETLFC